MPEGTAQAARVVIEVVAGVIPGQAMPEYTRRYAITADEWHEAGAEQHNLLAERNGRAQGYAALLMLSPDHVNWVRVDWLWL